MKRLEANDFIGKGYETNNYAGKVLHNLGTFRTNSEARDCFLKEVYH